MRGDGCYVYDEHGKKYFDGLSALFCVNAGHGRAELGEAAAEQAKELASTPTGATPTRVPSSCRRSPYLAPGDLNRVFFTSGGSEAVESAWKLSRAYHKLRGDTQRTKIIARDTAYHGTTFGALSCTGITALRTQFEPLVPRPPRAQHEHLPPARWARRVLGCGSRSRSASSSRAPRPWP